MRPDRLPQIFTAGLLLLFLSALFGPASVAISGHADGLSYDASSNQLTLDDAALDAEGHLNPAQKTTISHFARGRGTSQLWATSAGGSGADMIWDMVLDNSDNAYVVGTFTGTASFGSTTLSASGGLDAFVAKLDAFGNWQWARSGGGANTDIATSVDIDSSSNVYVAGFFTDNSASSTGITATFGGTTLTAHSQSSYDMFAAKLDSSGSWQWAQTSKKTSSNAFGQVMLMDLMVWTNYVIVFGSYLGELWAYDDPFWGEGTQGSFKDATNAYTSDVYIAGLSMSGTWEWVGGRGGDTSDDMGYALESTPDGGFMMAGTFNGQNMELWGQYGSSSGTSADIFVIYVDSSMTIRYLVTAGGTGEEIPRGMLTTPMDGSGGWDTYVVGEFDGVLVDFGPTQLSTSGDKDIFVGRIPNGTAADWSWARRAGGPGEDLGFSIVRNSTGALFMTGQVAGQVDFEHQGSMLIVNSSGANDAFIAEMNEAGAWQQIRLAGGPSGGDRGWALGVDNNDLLVVAGRFKGGGSNPAHFDRTNLSSSGDYDAFVWKLNMGDSDGDGFPDISDDCPTVAGSATIPPYIGCPDADGDGYADVDDDFPAEGSQWRDADGDQFGDNPFGVTPDNCTNVPGNSTRDRIGCPDLDADGWSDADLDWPVHPTGSADAFPTEPTQWNDTDEDGYGDNWADAEWTDFRKSAGIGEHLLGARDPDHCPTQFGGWTHDAPGCPDDDGDGWSNLNDDFPSNPTQWKDTDGDGWGDNQSEGATQVDDLPYDDTQYRDHDGDGYGDARDGNNPDAFPEDPTQWSDLDGDEYGDNAGGTTPDGCPTEVGTSTQDQYGCPDSDKDGTSDANDAFPDEWSQWEDTDGDGAGDNYANPNQQDSRPTHWPGGYVAGAEKVDPSPLDRDDDGFEDGTLQAALPQFDQCPDIPGTSTEDRVGCPDVDGDGYSDDGDDMDNDSTQWSDEDSDGFGANPDGYQPDACPKVPGTSWIDRFGCPDSDGDGISDPMQAGTLYAWNASQGADKYPADVTRWNSTHDPVKATFGIGDSQRSMWFGIGLGALIAMTAVVILLVAVMRMMAPPSEYDDAEYEDDYDASEQDGQARAQAIAQQWKQTEAPPPPPLDYTPPVVQVELADSAAIPAPPTPPEVAGLAPTGMSTMSAAEMLAVAPAEMDSNDDYTAATMDAFALLDAMAPATEKTYDDVTEESEVDEIVSEIETAETAPDPEITADAEMMEEVEVSTPPEVETQVAEAAEKVVDEEQVAEAAEKVVDEEQVAEAAAERVVDEEQVAEAAAEKVVDAAPIDDQASESAEETVEAPAEEDESISSEDWVDW